MAADVDIANLALSAIGSRSTISSLTENSTESNAVSLHWQPAVRATLREFKPGFARSQITLADLGSPPAPWQHRYAHPSDCLRAMYIMPTWATAVGVTNGILPLAWIGPPVRYLIALDKDKSGSPLKVILTDQDTAVLVYISSAVATVPSIWDDDFVDVMALVLAARIALTLTGKLSIAQAMQKAASDKFALAQAGDGNESPRRQDVTADWIRVRGYEEDYAYPDRDAFGLDPLFRIG